MASDTHFLPWHQKQFASVVNIHQQGRLSHAYLLHGAQGLGKFGFAYHLARYLICSSPKGDTACLHCSNCLLFETGHHPDIKILKPLEDKKVIGVDQVRACVDFLQKTANQGGYKVLITPQSELMNINASNALLKTLEEPPEKTLILMISHQPGLVLATIRSRCQSLLFKLPEPEAALDWLNEHVVSGNTDTLLTLAKGAPLKALEYADEDWQHIRSEIHQVLIDLLKENTNVVAIVNNMEKTSLEINLETMMLSVYDLICHYQSERAFPLNDPDLQTLHSVLPHGCLLSLHYFYSELLKTRKILSKGIALNARLSMESLLLRWSNIGKLSSQI